MVESAERDYNSYIEEYNKKIMSLNSTYFKYRSHEYSLNDLFNANKLMYGNYGELVLNVSSRQASFYTEVDDCVVRTLGYKPDNARLVREVRYTGTGFQPDYVVAYDFKRKIWHRDNMFAVAERWTNSPEYENKRVGVINAYNRLKELESKVISRKKDAEKWHKNPEYVALCVKYNELGDEYDKVADELKGLEGKL